MLPDVGDGGFDLLKNALVAENEFLRRTAGLLRTSGNTLQRTSDKKNMVREGATELVLDNVSGGISRALLLPEVWSVVTNVKTPDSVKARIAELLVGTPEEVATAIKSIEKLTSKGPSRDKLRQEFREEVVGGATRLVESESDDTY